MRSSVSPVAGALCAPQSRVFSSRGLFLSVLGLLVALVWMQGSAEAALKTWDGGAGAAGTVNGHAYYDWVVAANWDNDTLPTANDDVQFTGTGVFIQASNVFNGTSPVKSIQFSSNGWEIWGNSTGLIIGATPGVANVTVDTGITATFSCKLLGTVGLTKLGAGTLVMGNNLTFPGAPGPGQYTGATTIQNGTLQLGIAAGIPATSALVIGNNVAATTSILDLNDFSLSVPSLASPTLFAGAAAYVENDGTTNKTLTLTGLATTSWGGIIRNNDGVGGHTGTLNFALTNSSGASSLTLTNSNTYTGTTVITHGGSASAGAIILGCNNAFPPASSMTLNGVDGGTYVDFILNGFNQEVAALNGNGGAFISNKNVASSVTSIFTVNQSSTTTFTGHIWQPSGGKIAFVKDGSGSLTLTPTWAYDDWTGSTTIKNGTLAMGGGLKRWPLLSDWIIGSNTTGTAVLNTSGLNFTMNSLTGTLGTGGAAYIQNDTTATNSILTITQSVDTTYEGVFRDHSSGTGTLSVAKSGTGILNLKGISTFSGLNSLGVTVGGNVGNGTLNLLSGAQFNATYAGAIKLSLNGTLTGIGSIDNVNWTNNGTLAPGQNGVGVLTVTGASGTVVDLATYATSASTTKFNSTLSSPASTSSVSITGQAGVTRRQAISGSYGELLLPVGSAANVQFSTSSPQQGLSFTPTIVAGFAAPRGTAFAVIHNAGTGALTVNRSFATYTNGYTWASSGQNFRVNYGSAEPLAAFDADGVKNDMIVYSLNGNAPTMTPATGSLTFTESANASAAGDAIQLLPALSLTDLDGDNITGATVTISTGFETSKDKLEYATTNGITGSFVDNGTTGVLTLSGTGTAADYQAALLAVNFRNTSENPSTAARTVTIVVNDNGATNNISPGTSVTSTTITRTLNVVRTNDPPLANSQTLSPNPDEESTTAVTLTGSDREGQSLNYTITALPSKGTLKQGATTISSVPFPLASNTVSYVGNLDQVGADSFQFKTDDGTDSSIAATVSLTLNNVNDAPVWASGTPGRPQNDTITPGASITQNLLATDVDAGDTLTYSGFSVSGGVETALPTSGAISFNPTTRVFSFSSSTQASYNFRFKVKDASNAEIVEDITIAVTTAANTAPSFNTTVANQTINEDTATSALTFTVADVQTPATNLDVTASSSNPTLIPNANIVIGPLSPTNGNRTVTVTPAADQNGTATITLTVSDNDLTTTSTFTVTVTAVNDAPSFNAGIAPAVNEDAGAQTVANFATNLQKGPLAATDEASQTLSFNVASNNSSLFSVQPAIDSSGTLTYTPAANKNGSATVTVSVSDNGSPVQTSGDQTFTITVNAVNDAPSFTKGANQTVPQNSASQSVANWATGISPGPSDEAGQSVSFLVANNNNSLFAVQPTVSASGTLTYQPASGAIGTATVSVVAQDNGSGTAPNVNQSAAQTFSITVNAGPVIFDFDPDFGQNGSYLVISGSGFNVVGGVEPTVTMGNGLGGSVTVPDTNVDVDSANQLTVLIPDTARSGSVSVTSGSTTTFATPFIVIPKFKGTTAAEMFTPTAGTPGTTITISGKAFAAFTGTGSTFLQGTTTISYYGGVTKARFSAANNGFVDATTTVVNNDGSITATIPPGAIDGPVRLVYERSGVTANVTSPANFDVADGTGPAITSFGPTSGSVGSRVKIYGRGFTNTTAVQFVGSGATVVFNVISSTQINATVPNIPLGSYTLSVTKGGTTVNTSALTPSQFTVTRAPLINSFTPAQGVVDDAVNLSGANFTLTSDVQFAASPDGTFVSTGFVANSSTSMTVFVPDGAKTGYIKVINPFGSALSKVEYIVKPQVVSFSPSGCSLAQIVSGQVVTITGQSLKSLVKKVKFGVTGSSSGLSVGTKYTSQAAFDAATDGFFVVNNTTIVARVPQGLAVGAGKIRLNYQAGLDALTAPTQQADSTQDFTVTATKPAGGSFSAASARRQ